MTIDTSALAPDEHVSAIPQPRDEREGAGAIVVPAVIALAAVAICAVITAALY